MASVPNNPQGNGTLVRAGAENRVDGREGRSIFRPGITGIVGRPSVATFWNRSVDRVGMKESPGDQYVWRSS